MEQAIRRITSGAPAPRSSRITVGAPRVARAPRAARMPARRKPRRKPNYQAALYDPTQQLAGKGLAGAAKALTNLEFGPQRAAINRTLGVATRQGTALADRAQGYYGQLDRAAAPISAQEGAIGQLLNTTLGTNASSGNAAIAAALKAAQDRAAADEQVRGLIGGSQTAGASAEAQAANDLVTQNTQTAQNAAAASTADYQHLADLSRSATAAAGGEAHTELLNRLANQQAGYRGQLTDLAKTEGAANSKNLTGLRQQAFENLITQKGLNIKTAQLRADTALGRAKLTEDRRQKAADRRVKLRVARLSHRATITAQKARTRQQLDTVNAYGYSNREWLRMGTRQRQQAIMAFKKQSTQATTRPKTGRAAGKKGPSAHSVGIVTQIENARSDAASDPKLTTLGGAKLQQKFVKRGLPPMLAQAAQQLHDFGYVTPATQAALERAGVTVPAAWKRTGAQALPVSIH